MKYLFPLIFMTIIFSSCDSETHFPESLEERKSMLNKKQLEAAELKKDLNALDEVIAELEVLINEEDPVGIETTSVTTKAIKKSDFYSFQEVQGSLESELTANITSEIPGRITKLNIEEGDFVKKGQLVAVIDVENLTKQLAELQTSLSLASDVFERQKRLWDQKIGSEIQFLEAKNRKEQLEKSIESLEFQKSKANIFAPISGSVEKLNSKQGEVVSPGLTIANLLNLSKLKIVVDAPENLLPTTKKGKKVKIKIPALDQELTLPISHIGNTVNPANRTFTVEADISNSKGLYKPNLLALMYIIDYEREDILKVPTNMIQEEINGKKYLVQLGSDDTAKKVYITMGQSYNGETIIEEGLFDGIILIEKGARSLQDGDKVVIES